MKKADTIVMLIMLACMLTSFVSMFFVNEYELMYSAVAFIVSGACGILALAAVTHKST